VALHQQSTASVSPSWIYVRRMGRLAATIVLVAAMIVVIVGIDVLFLRHHLWPRLIVNVAIVLISGAIYILFIKK